MQDQRRLCKNSILGIAMISKEMTIDEILSRYPEKSQKLAAALSSSGLQCVGCGAATFETLEAGVFGHGMGLEDLNSILETLNAILDEKGSDPLTITITQRAADRFNMILKEEKKEGYALRFGDQPGGCGGFEYILDFSKKPTKDDEVLYSSGIEIHVNKKVLPRLLGCEIDYSEGLKSSGFKISNPNVKGSCSCGKSQSY